eukprot:gene4913-3525_t
MNGTPHYTRVHDHPESLNPVTGRSVYYGMRPWRCDDRFQDFVKSFTCMDSPSIQFSLLKTFWRCARSEAGEEPKGDYYRLGREEVMFYVERYRSNMVRVGAFETYPYDQNELKRVSEEDGLKMRVWRHQREMELSAKQGKVEDVMHSVLSLSMVTIWKLNQSISAGPGGARLSLSTAPAPPPYLSSILCHVEKGKLKESQACMLLFASFLLCLCLTGSAGAGAGGPPVPQDVWEVSLVSTAEGFIPPSHRLTLTEQDGEVLVSLAPIRYAAWRQSLFRLGRWLGYTAVAPHDPAAPSSAPLCPLPSDLWSGEFSGVWEPAGLVARGSSALLFPLSLPLDDQPLRRFSSPVRLEAAPGVPLAWEATGRQVLRLAPNHLVLVMEFQVPHTAGFKRCEVVVEGVRMEATATEGAAHTPLLGIVALLGLVWFLRSRVASHGVGKLFHAPTAAPSTPQGLSSEQREQLLQQQHDIIQRMREEDARQRSLVSVSTTVIASMTMSDYAYITLELHNDGCFLLLCLLLFG